LLGKKDNNNSYRTLMRHIEFIHNDHFEKYYHRKYVTGELSFFIDFFWETKFDDLLKQYPKGFSDALFPNIGYTYLINLGTPFMMQVGDRSFEMKGDGFLPRPNSVECFHRSGNKLFGIKFRISPVVFEKKINFSEYRGYIFPLSYLLEQRMIERIKKAASFEKRVQLLTAYYQSIVERHHGLREPIRIVSSIVDECIKKNNFTTSVEIVAGKNNISTRTLQRYFEMTTGISSKKAMQILRIRAATYHLTNTPQTFHYSLYGYYDRSHFYKHLKGFLHKKTFAGIKPHLILLKQTASPASKKRTRN
jgi:AraC-like DNA-binding protein